MTASSGASFTAADLIRSVNKRVRQQYIRRRLLTTYKALERLSLSQFNLDQIASVALTQSEEAGGGGGGGGGESDESTGPNCGLNAALTKNAITISDVEREQGRPLSKYDRNMMIFNWLHNLEDSPSEA